MLPRTAEIALERPLAMLGAAGACLALTAAVAVAGPGELSSGGVPPGTRSELIDDVVRIGVIIGPILLLGLMAALGWRLALATVAVGAISITGAAGALHLAGAADIVEPAETALIPACGLGAGLAIEASVLFAASYKRAVRAGGDRGSSAAHEATKVAGAAALTAAACAAAAFGALAAIDVDYLRAASLAGAAGALLAGLGALLVLPAVVALWGWSIPGFSEGGFWRRSAAVIGRNWGGALAVAVFVVTLMFLQATPVGRAALTTVTSATVSGSAGEFADALPLAAAIAAAAVAVLLAAASRRPALACVLALAGLLPAAAATGIAVAVFQEGRLAERLQYTPEGVLHLGAVACGAALLAALAAARGGALASVIRRERSAPGPARVEEAQGIVGPASAVATLVLATASFALLAADLLAAKEFGFLVGAGLILDLVAVRVLMVPALARLTEAA